MVKFYFWHFLFIKAGTYILTLVSIKVPDKSQCKQSTCIGNRHHLCIQINETYDLKYFTLKHQWGKSAFVNAESSNICHSPMQLTLNSNCGTALLLCKLMNIGEVLADRQLNHSILVVTPPFIG